MNNGYGSGGHRYYEHFPRKPGAGAEDGGHKRAGAASGVGGPGRGHGGGNGGGYYHLADFLVNFDKEFPALPVLKTAVGTMKQQQQQQQEEEVSFIKNEILL